MAVLDLAGVKKNFGGTEVLRQIDLSLSDGEMLVIVGASGCGKSTLLRIVAGLETASEGRISLDGRDITNVDPAARDIAMVFQNYALYPHMTVFDNMAYGLKIAKVPLAEIKTRVDKAARILELGPYLQRKPRELSGGQQQRVAIARALAMQPRMILYDEPTSALDPELVAEVLDVMGKLSRDGMTSLVVTHEIACARQVADRVIFMADGRVVETGPAHAVIDRPAEVETQRFLSHFHQQRVDMSL